MIDPKDFSLSLGNIVATHVFIEKVNAEFKALEDKIVALEEKLEKQAVATSVASPAKKTTKAV